MRIEWSRGVAYIKEILAWVSEFYRNNNDQHRQCGLNVILWLVCVNIVAVETQQCILSLLLSHVSLLTVQIILSDAYQCSYGQFLSAAKTKRK